MITKHNVLVTTVPFGAIDPKPLTLLQQEPGVETLVNPIGRRLTSDELTVMIRDATILIAGTEPIKEQSLRAAKRLKIICRVGIGLDNVDLVVARELGIKVTYTPDAPAPAVAEMTIAHMLNLCRSLGRADRQMRAGTWHRHMGVRLHNSVVGIIGAGRIGSRVIRHLGGFSPQRILVNDIVDISELCRELGCVSASKEEIFAQADVISLHVPLTQLTRNLITTTELRQMKPTAMLVNTARGGIVNEADLFEALKRDTIAGAAVDVFEDEPYDGPLLRQENAVLSCHMGSCTRDCRFAMELEAVEDGIRLMRGEPLKSEVPQAEYENQLNMR